MCRPASMHQHSIQGILCITILHPHQKNVTLRLSTRKQMCTKPRNKKMANYWNTRNTCGLLMYGFMSSVRPNSIFLSIFPPELPVPLNLLNCTVRILGDLSIVNCFSARTFFRQFPQWYLLSPSKASTAVNRFKAFVRESARTISKLRSKSGS